MTIKFDPTITLGNFLTVVVITGGVLTAYVDLRGTEVKHDAQIVQINADISRTAAERLIDKGDLKEIMREIKVDIKEVKDSLNTATVRLVK